MTKTVQLYQDSRSGDAETVVVEGAHAFKHAWRFGAEFVDVTIKSREMAFAMMHELAGSKEASALDALAHEVSEEEFAKLSFNPPYTGIIALAKKPECKRGHLLHSGLVIFLENPNSLYNVGAVIRVAAARNAVAVLVSGEQNPWHAECIRTAAGLHFALPQVVNINSRTLSDSVLDERPLIAMDADGENIYETEIPNNAILAFGTERGGLTDELKNKANKIVSLPMQKGVSSLNLATSVAATIYAKR